MNHGGSAPVRLLIVAVAVWLVLVSAGPTLVELVRAAVPLVIVVGLVVAVLRLVHFHTNKW